MRILEFVDKNYPDREEYLAFIDVLKEILSKNYEGFDIIYQAGGSTRINHLRLKHLLIAPDKIFKKFDESGKFVDVRGPDQDTVEANASGSLPIYVLEYKGKKYIVVHTVRRTTSKSGGKSLIPSKKLTPNNMGLTGKKWTDTQLEDEIRDILPSIVVNSKITAALNQIVDVAVGKRPHIDEEFQEMMMASKTVISADFGEVLVPLMMGGNEIEFPEAINEPLVDVYVDGEPISVKSGGGSGTSMNSISENMKHYELHLSEKAPKEQKAFKILNNLLTMTTNQWLVWAAEELNVGEMKRFKEKSKMKPTVENLRAYVSNYPDIDAFIQDNMDIYEAGGWGSPSGLPKKRLPLVFKNNAENFFIYAFGVGVYRYINNGKDKEVFSKVINDVIQSDVVQYNIDLTKDGRLTMNKKTFNEMTFKFDYHARVEQPNRNKPGFKKA